MIGFRSWLIQYEWDERANPVGYLWSNGAGSTRWWGEMQAVCIGVPFGYDAESHAPPGSECGCGLYALHEPAMVPGGELVGAVVAWGELEVHDAGFRAENARIAVLARSPRNGNPILRDEDLAEIAARYSVPLVPWQELEAEALRFGKPVPESMRPLVRGRLAT